MTLNAERSGTAARVDRSCSTSGMAVRRPIAKGAYCEVFSVPRGIVLCGTGRCWQLSGVGGGGGLSCRRPACLVRVSGMPGASGALKVPAVSIGHQVVPLRHHVVRLVVWHVAGCAGCPDTFAGKLLHPEGRYTPLVWRLRSRDVRGLPETRSARRASLRASCAAWRQASAAGWTACGQDRFSARVRRLPCLGAGRSPGGVPSRRAACCPRRAGVSSRGAGRSGRASGLERADVASAWSGSLLTLPGGMSKLGSPDEAGCTGARRRRSLVTTGERIHVTGAFAIGEGGRP